MAKLFVFEVHTPHRPFFSEKVEAIVLALVDGEIGVYAGHSPFTAPSVTGALRIRDRNGKWRPAFITEGILEVKEHKTVLMVDAAEWPEEIDTERAKAAKREAGETLDTGMLKFEIDKARVKLKRAEWRLKVAEMKEQPAV
ncbi:MAG: ATP synthase F1 subunit epsilon [Treponema sp.]|jgi:F-type H+-transporting ATPase subunit epsilon|nr:ATP synthase F1 subunit epsilon [Treponema sp.]